MELFAKMDVKAIQNGLIQKVGGVKHFSVLAAIASFANGRGEAFPSQDTIAEMVGYSRKTVNQYVGELREVQIDNEPILRVIQEKTPKGRRNKYLLSPNSGFWFGSNVVTKTADNVTESGIGVVTTGLQELELKELELKELEKEKDLVFDNAKSVLEYFRQQYFNKYNVAYQPNYGRDQAMIKSKLLSNFTDSQIKAIVDVTCSEYDKRWAKPTYPRPTIGQLCSWLGNEALAIASNKKEQADKIEVDSKKYEMTDDALDRLLNEI